MPTLKQQVLATMKSTDTEGPFELYATRTPGYLWALLFKRLGVHPIAVTLMSMLLGCACGWFFYQSSLIYNVIGMALLVVANWFDCADGQLARMTGQKTLIGRILDGFAGDAWFFCIYLGIALRLSPQWGVWIWILVAWAGFFCHARQCALADYYRNAHLLFIGAGGELDRSADIEARYHAIPWHSSRWFEKIYLFFYASYTRGQEKATPQFQRFYTALLQTYHRRIPRVIAQRYRAFSRPLMPACQILTFDVRVGVLFLSLLVGMPWIYPLTEVTAFEVLRLRTNRRHEHFCRALYQNMKSLSASGGNVS